jgi:predicted GIY-YIG superfamily endonuclease
MKKNNYKVSLVYKVVNKTNGETYIGATTKSIENRMADHLQKANKGVGGCFQEAIATYGPEAFSWEQIDTANSADELAQKEKDYILEYDSKKNGYNSDSGGGFEKTVYQYNYYPNDLITSYKNLKEVEEKLGFDKRRISNACLNVTPWMGSFWSYSPNCTFAKFVDYRKKTVYQYDLNCNLIEVFSSTAEASRKTGVSKTCISRCCREEREKSGGYRWQYDRLVENISTIY